MKRSVYFDTTIPNYMYDQRESIKFETNYTKNWWQTESKHYDLFLSNTTLAELEEGNYPHQQEAIDFVAKIPLLEKDDDIKEIALIYMDHYLMPKEYEGDAFHLAYASFYNIDFILTWNCNHLANANKKQHILIINTRLNLSTPEIITPLQLITEKKGKS